jgi:hypothetical protein
LQQSVPSFSSLCQLSLRFAAAKVARLTETNEGGHLFQVISLGLVLATHARRSSRAIGSGNEIQMNDRE